jgi:uncharacterized protein
MNLNTLYSNRWWLIRMPALLICSVLAIFLCTVVWPVPHASLRISTGSSQGAYYRIAKSYEAILAQRGISLEVLSSEGTPENLSRLAAQPPKAELAFAQGGFGLLGTASDTGSNESIETLANVAIEPLWLLTRRSGLQDFTQLAGLKIGVGGGQSGSRHVLKRLMELHRLRDHEMQLVTLSGFDLIKGLESGQVDAVFHVATPESPVVRGLLDVVGVQLVQLSRTSAIVERLPYLEPRLLTQGSLIGHQRHPDTDMTMLTTYASLVAHNSLHPALQRQLLAAAHEVHQGSGRFHRTGDFPSLRQLDFPVSMNVINQDTLHGLLPLWEKNLPFFWAQWLERFLFVVLPLALLAAWLCAALPHWVESRMRQQLDALYGQLQFIEEDMHHSTLIQLDYEQLRRKLLTLDEKISRMSIPKHLTQRWLTLRAHVDFVNRSSYRLRGR